LPNYLVVATSGRAIAQGLASLGYTVAVVDGFADSDTYTAASEVLKSKRSHFGLDFDSVMQAVYSLQSKLSFDGLFFDAAIEANPNLLDVINVNPVLGNSKQVLENVSNVELFFSTLDQYSIPYPETKFNLSSELYSDGVWLQKSAQTTGGIGVAHLNPDIDVPDHFYFQRKISGISFSITFLANGRDIAALGFNTLLQESLGATVPYAYAGAINYFKLEETLQAAALNYAKVLVQEFDLVGLNSIDFIYADNSIYVLEINPRIPATYELYESKYGELINQHIEACLDRRLPEIVNKPLLRAHAIIYAPTEIIIPEGMVWPLWTADRPQAKELIKKFDPVCSIFAGGKNYAQTNEMIKTRKQSILAKLLAK